MLTQAALNRQMKDEGVARYRNSVAAAKRREEESATLYGRKLLSVSILPFADAIKAWMKAVAEKGRGRRASAYRFLERLRPEVAAFVAAQAVIDCLAVAKPMTSSAVIIGKLIENETRWEWLKNNHVGLYRYMVRHMSEDHSWSYDRKASILIAAMNRLGLSTARPGKVDKVFSPWSSADRLQVGMTLLDLFEQSTGLVKRNMVRRGTKTQWQIEATEKTLEWVNRFNTHAEVMNPVYMPSVDMPEKWTGPFAGGYTGLDFPSQQFVKRVNAQDLKTIVEKADMTASYEAVNALQETPWAINKPVLEVIEQFLKVRRNEAGLPDVENRPLPEKPKDIETNKEARAEWRSRAARVHGENVSLASQRLQVLKVVNLARKFAGVEKFYFPYQCDFRGRVYTIPTFLTPQGNDIARGLLTFAEGCPINDDNDAYWLAVAGANLFGKDKVTFEERVDWVKDNREAILATAKDPLGSSFWLTAEEPWQFLAWCFEWSGWLQKGPGFISHLPVCLDGTNNGLQILSLLSRDTVAAKATNVSPSTTPQDIYGDVAKEVVKELTADAENRALAEFWQSIGINRKTTKRQVMVLPYGGTFTSCLNYTVAWYEEIARTRGLELPEWKEVSRRCLYLARAIWDAISSTVGLPREVMDWLQACAGVFAKANIPVVWTAPSGFPVMQAYKDTRLYQVKARLGDAIVKLALEEDTPKLSGRRQRNGIAPNYVHSLDASALVRTVQVCLKSGVTSFAMIHDSYGTHAPKVHTMAAALRKAFVDIFTEDRLAVLRDQLQAQLAAAGIADELPPIPAYGELDVRELHDSEFFFA